MAQTAMNIIIPVATNPGRVSVSNPRTNPAIPSRRTIHQTSLYFLPAIDPTMAKIPSIRTNIPKNISRIFIAVPGMNQAYIPKTSASTPLTT